MGSREELSLGGLEAGSFLPSPDLDEGFEMTAPTSLTKLQNLQNFLATTCGVS